MKTESANEVISRWFKEVGFGANDALYLNVEPTRAYISDAAGEIATLCSDWDVLMVAENIEALAEILARDL